MKLALLLLAPAVLLAAGCGVLGSGTPGSAQVLANTPVPMATGPFPTPAQVEAQRLNPALRFERPGMGASWMATPTGWAWSPAAAVDRP